MYRLEGALSHIGSKICETNGQCILETGRNNLLLVCPHPGDDFFAELVDAIVSQGETDARLDDLRKIAKVSVILGVVETPLEKDRGHVYEPEAPGLRREFTRAARHGTNELSGYILHGLCGLLPNFLPNLRSNFIVLGADVETFERAAPELDKNSNNIFEKQMHDIPWKGARIVEATNASESW